MKKKYKKYSSKELASEEGVYGYGEIWTTLDGQDIPLINLRDDHLDNIIKHAKKRSLSEILPFLLEEKKRRNKDKLIKSTRFGKLLYGRK